MKIAFFSTTRAETAYLLPLLDQIEVTNDIDYSLYIGGTHLAPEYGLTINEIIDSGHNITDVFDYLLNSDSSYALGASTRYLYQN